MLAFIGPGFDSLVSFPADQPARASSQPATSAGTVTGGANALAAVGLGLADVNPS